MPRHAERRQSDSKPPHRDPRLRIDRAWVLRVLLAVVVVALVLLIAKAAMMAFDGATRRKLGIRDEPRDARVLADRGARPAMALALPGMPLHEC
jgi:hypothetical protein